MKKVLIIMVGFAVLLSAAIVTAENEPVTTREGSNVAPADGSQQALPSDRVVVYYLHMNRRCATCQKLEAYSKEAVDSGFAEQLKDSSLVFTVQNFEQEGNEHFAKDYQLYSQSLILSRLHDGKETEWKNLDKIWELVGNKEEFIAYVQAEISDFVNSEEKK